MVVIRLARGGSKGRPFFKIVVADSRSARVGRFIEKIGFYNPFASGDDVGLRIHLNRLTHWVGTGAQMSSAVRRLAKEFEKQAAV